MRDSPRRNICDIPLWGSESSTFSFCEGQIHSQLNLILPPVPKRVSHQPPDSSESRVVRLWRSNSSWGPCCRPSFARCDCTGSTSPGVCIWQSEACAKYLLSVILTGRILFRSSINIMMRNQLIVMGMKMRMIVLKVWGLHELSGRQDTTNLGVL